MLRISADPKHNQATCAGDLQFQRKSYRREALHIDLYSDKHNPKQDPLNLRIAELRAQRILVFWGDAKRSRPDATRRVPLRVQCGSIQVRHG